MSTVPFDFGPDAMNASLNDPMALNGVNRLTHLVELHRAGHFDPTAGPASSALAARLAQHAMGGMVDPTAGTAAMTEAPATPGLEPSGMVLEGAPDLGGQKPGASFMDQLANSINADDSMPHATGDQSSGAQFLTELLRSAAQSYGVVHGKEMSDKQRLTDALEARTADRNRRNLDLQDRRDLLKTEHGYREGESVASDTRRTKAKADEVKAGQRPISPTLARMLGDPSLAGQTYDEALVAHLESSVQSRRAAEVRGSSRGGADDNLSKQDALRYKVLNGRLDKMDQADVRDFNAMNAMGATREVKQALWAKIQARDKDRQAVQQQVTDMENGFMGKPATPAGVTTDAGGANPTSPEAMAADPTAEIASLRAEAKRVNRDMSATGAMSADRQAQARVRMGQIEQRMRQLGTSLNAVSGVEATPTGARQIGRDAGAMPPTKVPVLGPNGEKGMALPGQQLQGGWRYV